MISAGLPTCRSKEDWAANALPESKSHMDSVMVGIQSEWANRRVRAGEDGSAAGVRGTGYSAALGGGRTPESVVAEHLALRGGGGGFFGGAGNEVFGGLGHEIPDGRRRESSKQDVEPLGDFGKAPQIGR